MTTCEYPDCRAVLDGPLDECRNPKCRRRRLDIELAYERAQEDR